MNLIKYTISFLLVSVLIPELRAQQQITLSDALHLARLHNPELKQQSLEVRKATAEKVVARSLFLPTVHAGGQLNHYFRLPAFFGFGDNAEGGKIPYGRFGGEDQLALTVVAVQPLYNPLASPSNQHARIKHESSQVALRSREIEVLAEVEDTYYSILVLQERRRLTEESIQRNKKVLQDSRMLFFQGKGLRVDTLRAYTSVKNLEPDLVKLTYAIKTSTLELRSLIGIDSLQELVPVDSLTIPAIDALPNEEFVFETALHNNPEFQMLLIRHELDKQAVRVAAAYRRPSLSLVGQYQVMSQTRSFEYGNAHYPTSSLVGLQLSVPLFTGFSTNAKIRQASLSEGQSELEVSKRRDILRTRVHGVIADNKEALLRLKNTAIVRETAQLSYDIIQYRYKNGISPRLELTDAELALSTAQSNYLEAVYDYLSARIALRKLTGI